MKNIIERSLPLNQTYTLTDKKYIPLVESYGACCDNCGQLIANIATVRSADGKIYEIGFDCLETILINNSLLTTGDIAAYEAAKKMIHKIIRFSKHIKEKVAQYPTVTGILFERPFTDSPMFPFYWLQHGQDRSRDNDYVKLKDVDFTFLLETLKNIFPKLTIIAH